jgi:hypothetical protein
LGEHFTSLALRHQPGSFELSKVTPKLPEPNLKTAVIIQVREPVRGVEVKDGCGLGRDETSTCFSTTPSRTSLMAAVCA